MPRVVGRSILGRHTRLHRVQALLERRNAARAVVALVKTPEGALRVLLYLGVIVVNLLQHPGVTTFDTKLDLLLNPGGFMRRSLSMWNPLSTMGEIQNQAYGFLFPMGPFFWVGHEVGLPPWFWERVWSALVLLVALEGARRIVRALGLGPLPALVAGLSYALAPRMVATIGVLTGEALPGAVLPWTVLPLLLGLAGRLPMRRALPLSAASVVFMGGQNATEVLATLPLPFLVLALSNDTGRRRLAHIVSWSGMVAVACSWWLGPLLLLGRYSPDFLDYIESAANVTAPVDWLATIRGATHWVAYLPVGLSHWPAGFEVTNRPLLVLLTTLIGATGVLGLVISGRLPHRRAWTTTALGAMTIMALGHGGITGSVLAEPLREFLDGVGSPFRNIHKFDPAARLPIAVGLAGATRLGIRWVNGWQPFAEQVRARAWLHRAPSLAVVGVVTLLGLPAISGDLRAPDGWREVPQAWRDASRYLGSLPAQDRSLIVPGSGFASQTWGRTVDEVLQVDGGVSFATRSQVPLAPAGSVRLLESFEQTIASGRPSAALAPALARAGFSHLVVRNDLLPNDTDAPSPARVHATVSTSPGLQRTAAFGVGRDGYPMVEVFAVQGFIGLVAAAAASDVVTFNGGADHLLQAVDSKVLDPTRPTVSSSSGHLVGRPTTDLMTETQERRERNFGRVHDAISSVMSPSDPYVLHRRVHDYGSSTDSTRLTAADYGPIAALSTSSGASRPDSLGPVQADRGPWAALDGSLETSWVSAPLTSAAGQWFQVELKAPISIGAVDVLFDRGAFAHVRAVTVSTDRGSERILVNADGKGASRSLPSGKVSRLRIRVDAVEPGRDGQVALANLSIGGLDQRRSLVVPGAADAATTLSFAATPAPRSCLEWPLGLTCGPGPSAGAEEGSGIDRTFDVGSDGEWKVAGYVVPTRGSTLASLFEPLDDKARVTASSSYDGDPQVNPSRAFDGDPLTGWLSAESDTKPTLQLDWTAPRTITRVQVSNTRGLPGRRPRSVTIEANGSRQVVAIGSDGFGVLRPITTDRLRLTFASSKGDPIGVTELVLNGLSDLKYQASPASTTRLPCGFGPRVTVDGTVVETRISGTLGDVLSGARMRVEPCAGVVALTPGKHRIQMASSDGFQPTNLALTPALTTRPQARAGATEIVEWAAAERRVRVGGTGSILLTVAENANAGWVATVGGQRLSPVTVDGWKQGWVVPGEGVRTVTLTFEPSHRFTWAIGLGGAAALGLLVVALAGWTRPRPLLSSSRGGGPTSHLRVQGRYRAATVASAVIAATVFAGVPAGLGVLAAALIVARYCAPVLAAIVVLPCAAAAVSAAELLSHRVPQLPDALSGTAAGLVVGVLIAGTTSRER